VAPVQFCDRLAELRRQRGLTQVQLAARVGVHPSQLHRYEAGGAQPTLEVIRQMCVALSVSADALLFADDARPLVEDRLQRALEQAVHLSEHEQVVIAEVVEAFVTARVAKEKSNLPRGPVPRRKRQDG
jgi:transcriptional regulator with XRE-family HTH domain